MAFFVKARVNLLCFNTTQRGARTLRYKQRIVELLELQETDGEYVAKCRLRAMPNMLVDLLVDGELAVKSKDDVRPPRLEQR